jgi:serine/threonine-protein kinase
VDDSGNWDVWIYDLARETSSRVTFDPATDSRQVWTRDGQRVVFSSARGRVGAPDNLFWKAADGTGSVERLTTSDYSQIPHSWSLDGRTLVFEQQNPETAGSYRGAFRRQDLYLLSMDGERIANPLLQTEFTEDRPAISHDGRWIVYRSNESGRFEIYVRPFPNVEDGKWMISQDGGNSPVWGPQGREIFYRSLEDGAMMAAKIRTEPTFTAEAPVVLFTGNYYRARDRNYDISPDGRRFLMLKEVGQSSDPDTLVVVLNWFEELKRLVPTE